MSQTKPNVLFMMADDPAECHDRSEDPAHAETLRDMSARLHAQQVLLDDPLATRARLQSG